MSLIAISGCECLVSLKARISRLCKFRAMLTKLLTLIEESRTKLEGLKTVTLLDKYYATSDWQKSETEMHCFFVDESNCSK